MRCCKHSLWSPFKLQEWKTYQLLLRRTKAWTLLLFHRTWCWCYVPLDWYRQVYLEPKQEATKSQLQCQAGKQEKKTKNHFPGNIKINRIEKPYQVEIRIYIIISINKTMKGKCSFSIILLSHLLSMTFHNQVFHNSGFNLFISKLNYNTTPSW